MTVNYRRRGISHGREAYYILVIILVTAGAIFGIWGPGGLQDMKQAERELHAHRSRVDELRRSNAERLQSIQALRYDKEALEKYARGKGYVRRDEIIQQLPEEIPSRNSKASPEKP
jgi:cell division protein FtsB